MKKIIITVSLSLLMLGIIGCGAKTETNTDVKQQFTTTETEVKKDIVKFPECQQQIGNGKIYVSTPAGTSENGNIPTLMVQKDTKIT
ncbi:hypothetical protein [Clostridium pasteurianum]|uniref:hypothetical protein n=1 Tax=Clostridium pasteurianum TaxID=1501 RepID=UPI000686E139|nr:hypothetical protein [Clostridium pasteurianum]